jgi:hypothetical protein
MVYKLKANGKEISHVSPFHWEDDIEKMSSLFNFTTDEKLDCGSIIQLTNENKNIFTGIVIDTDETDNRIISYSGYDIGFYFGHNNVIKQFKKNCLITKAIKILCSEYDIPLGKVQYTGNVTVKNNYKNKTLDEVFADLLKLLKLKSNRNEFYWDCRNGRLNLLHYTENKELAGWLCNIMSTPATNTIHETKYHKSIEELRNQVIITDNNGKVLNKIPAKDKNSIAKYGLLQHIEEVDTDKKNNYQKLSTHKLYELNKIISTLSLKMLGDYEMHKGVIFPLKIDKFNINNDYLIMSSKHDIYENKEEVEVDLKIYGNKV